MEIGAARLDEHKWLQTKTASSAADALLVQTDAVPAGKIWNVLALSYFASANETRNVRWGRVTRENGFLCGGAAAQRAVGPAPIETGFIDPCDTVVLYPGQRLRVYRDVATAGSTMTIDYILIESDAPYAQYVDPLRSVTRKPRRSLIPRAYGGGGGGESGGGGEGSAGSGFGGGGGPSEPYV